MAAKKPISISRHKISDQKWENHFPEGIFPWNLAHNWRLWIQLHCWNKIWKKLFGCVFMGKTNFEQCPKYANLCSLAELARGRCKFFCHQKKRKVKLDKVIEGLRPITLRFRANARKLILGSIGTPLDHLSVKISSSVSSNSSSF